MGFIATGTTVTFGTSSFSAELLSISGPSLSRESVDMSHMGTTGGKPFLPGDLYDGGEVTLELAFNPATALIISSAKETVTIAWADSSTTSWSFDAFCTGYEPTAPLEGRSTASLTLKVSGTPNYAA